jgi:1-acyl-sn-glycerol-3-phosphate acyltransferase
VLIIVPRSRRYTSTTLYRFLGWTYRALLWALDLSIIYDGEVQSFPTILIANHQSALDIPLMGALMRQNPHVWLAHEWYMRYPILGAFIRRIAISVRPQSAEKGVRTMRTSLSLLNQKECSVIIFPEGTRHQDGSVHDFRGGFVILARKIGLPVVPVFIKNAGIVLPPSSRTITPVVCRVVVGAAYTLGADETDEQFLARIRAWYQSHA